MRSFLLPVILLFMIHTAARAEDASTAFQKRVLPVLANNEKCRIKKVIFRMPMIEFNLPIYALLF